MSISILQVAATEIASIIGVSKPHFVGNGAYKETFKVVDSTGKNCALKLFNPHKFNRDRSEREIDAMIRCNHPYTAKVFSFDSSMLSDGNIYHYLLEDFYDGGNLTGRMEFLADTDIKHLSYNMISAIKHLKSLDLVHRDIKPDNIMFRANDNNAILVDFGLVRNIGEESLTASFLPCGPGTPFFSSPEQLNNDKHMIDWRSDQYSLGIMLCILLTGDHPMQQTSADKHEAIIRVSNREKIAKCRHTQLTESGFDYIIKMLEPWPIQRFNCPEELLKASTKGG